MSKKINLEFTTTEALLIYDLLLLTYENLQKSNDEGYKLYEPLLTTIENQVPGYKEYRELVKTID